MRIAIFKMINAAGYELVATRDGAKYDALTLLDGTPLRDSWVPLEVRPLTFELDGTALRPSDFPWTGSDTLILRARAVDALKSLLEANGEILPLATDDAVELFVLNVRAIDALDEASSTLIRIPGTDRIALVKAPAFFSSRLVGVDILRLPHRGSPIYVTETFVARVEAAGLRGLRFTKVATKPQAASC